MHASFATALAAVALACVPHVVAQQVPSVEELTRTVARLRQSLRLRALKAPTAEDLAALAKPEQELRDFVAWVERQQGLTAKHYIAASEPFALWYPTEARRIADAGVKRLPDSRELHVLLGNLLGNAASRLPPSAARLECVRASEAAFRRALACKPDTWPAHGGLAGVLADLGRGDEALAELQLAIREPEGNAFYASWQGPMLLVSAGEPREALRLLAAVTAAEREREAETRWPTRVDRLVLVLRATALTKDAAATRAAIRALRAAEQSSRTVIEAADALAYVGELDAARELLAERATIAAAAEEPASRVLDAARVAAAMEAVWSTADLSPAGPLLAKLVAALEHGDEVAKGADSTDLVRSPLLLCKRIADGTTEATVNTAWADDLLFVLAARAAATREPDEHERRALAALAPGEALPGVADVPARLLHLRTMVGVPYAAGALTGASASAKLDGAAAGRAGANTPRARDGK